LEIGYDPARKKAKRTLTGSTTVIVNDINIDVAAATEGGTPGDANVINNVNASFSPKPGKYHDPQKMRERRRKEHDT
jgi:hypothetical protein